MPYQRALAYRLGFEPGSPDYETTALPTELPSAIIVCAISFKLSPDWFSILFCFMSEQFAIKVEFSFTCVSRPLLYGEQGICRNNET